MKKFVFLALLAILLASTATALSYPHIAKASALAPAGPTCYRDGCDGHALGGNCAANTYELGTVIDIYDSYNHYQGYMDLARSTYCDTVITEFWGNQNTWKKIQLRTERDKDTNQDWYDGALRTYGYSSYIHVFGYMVGHGDGGIECFNGDLFIWDNRGNEITYSTGTTCF